jgi:predicted 3-demethylubiquinone-9 3-methyltransferase (glyoxalase superfamily)
MTQQSTLRTFLWFNSGLQDALKFYKATFGDAMEVSEESLLSEHLFTAEFSIYGHKLIGMNTPGGEQFNSAISLSLQVDGQEEIDRVWAAITAQGEPGPCGWCKDQWGVSWQVTPYQMGQYLGNPDPAKAQKNMELMRSMGKIQLSDFVE